MPKEVVYGVEMAPDGSDPSAVGRPQVEVRWMGVENGGNFLQIVTKEVSLIGGRLTDDEGIHYTDGLHVQLDREGVNRLIRSLRKARDRSFGRDE